MEVFILIRKYVNVKMENTNTRDWQTLKSY